MARTRSRSYPAIELREAVELLHQRLGPLQTGKKTRGEIAQLLGYSSTSGGMGMRKVVALALYGLLEKSRDGFILSELGESLQALESRGLEWKADVQAAFLKPSLFEDLISTYRIAGKLPEDLPAALESKFEIARNASANAARNFLKSGQFAGVLDGHLITLEDSLDTETEQADDDSPLNSSRSNNRTSILLTRNRYAEVSVKLPPDVNATDFSLVQGHFEHLAHHFGLLQKAAAAGTPVPFPGKRGPKGLTRSKT